MTNQNSNVSNPEIGMGATIQFHSDRTACTIIDVSNSGHIITLQEDEATRLDSNGFSETQTYSFKQNSKGTVYRATLRKDGRYRLAGKKGGLISIGTRDRFYDYSF